MAIVNMTHTPPYCTSNTTTDLITLINLARISGAEDYINQNTSTIKHALHHINNDTLAVQRLVPLIYSNTKKLTIFDPLPDKTKNYLRDTTLKLMAYEGSKVIWLNQMIKLFTGNSIPLILLKGAAFNNNLYPKETPRAGSDLDILIKQSDYNRACEILNNNGFLENIKIKPRVYDTLFERSYTPKTAYGIAIDLHKFLTHPALFHIDEDELWALSRPHPAYDNDQVRILSPEHTLLHLAIHAFRDHDFCTHNLLDSHEVICQCSYIKKRLLAIAKSWGAQHILYCLLKNCQVTMNTPIDNSTLNSLKPPYIKATLARLILRSPSTENLGNKTIKSRLIQVIGLIFFPDSLQQGFKLIKHYISMAILKKKE